MKRKWSRKKSGQGKTKRAKNQKSRKNKIRDYERIKYRFDAGTANFYNTTGGNFQASFNNFSLSQLPSAAKTFVLQWAYYKVNRLKITYIPSVTVNTSTVDETNPDVPINLQFNIGIFMTFVSNVQVMDQTKSNFESQDFPTWIAHPKTKIHPGNKKISRSFRPMQLFTGNSSPFTTPAVGDTSRKSSWVTTKNSAGTPAIDNTLWGTCFYSYQCPRDMSSAPIKDLTNQSYIIIFEVDLSLKQRLF